jgi:cation-transporting ATPase 13A1
MDHDGQLMTHRLYSGAAAFSGSLAQSNVISKIRVLHRYPFSSALKRMSVHTEVTVSKMVGAATIQNKQQHVVFCKGAPEVLATLLKEVPPRYRETYLYHMSRGKRVLALAYRLLEDSPSGRSKLARENAESDMVFAGFLAFDSDLKADTKGVIKSLRNANFHIVIITGDSAYTAADVARKLRLTTRTSSEGKAAPGTPSDQTTPSPLSSVLILVSAANRDTDSINSDRFNSSSDTPHLVWRIAANGDGSQRLPSDVEYAPAASALGQLAASHTLCVTGPALAVILQRTAARGPSAYFEELKALAPHVSIFARVSPSQKEDVVRSFNDTGMYTLMCGDGTNDVGALRAAHVGISVVNSPDLEDKVEAKVQERASAAAASPKKKSSSAASQSLDRHSRALAEMQLQQMDETVIKLGDASIASPFTSRRTSIDAVLSVIRQGRCTLVTMTQVGLHHS